MTNLLFLDLETVTLEARPGSVWEIGWASDEGPVHSIFVVPDLGIAQAQSLDMNRFGERYDHGSAYLPRDATRIIVDVLKSHTVADADGRHHPPVLVGSAPWFDAAHLEAMFGGLGPWWHHHHDDMPARAAGALGMLPPSRLKDVAAAAGLDIGAYELHTAGGDVALTRDLYRWWCRQSTWGDGPHDDGHAMTPDLSNDPETDRTRST